MWWVSNDESKVVDGDQSGPRAGTEGQWSDSLAIRWNGELVRDCDVVWWLLLLQDYESGSRGGGMRQGWRRVASDGAFGGMSRGWSPGRCCLAEAAAEVVPEDSDAGAVLRAMSQVFDRVPAMGVEESSAVKQSCAEQMDGCYQGARLYEANDECTEDEADAGCCRRYGSGGCCCWPGLMGGSVLGRQAVGVRCEGRSQCCSSSPGRQGMRALKHSSGGRRDQQRCPAGRAGCSGRWERG